MICIRNIFTNNNKLIAIKVTLFFDILKYIYNSYKIVVKMFKI
jgi:hypothetical protein